MDFSSNPLADKQFVFWDSSLLQAVQTGDPHAHEFFRLLSLCHTVMSEEKTEGASGAASRSPGLAAGLGSALGRGQAGHGRGGHVDPVLLLPSQASCTTRRSPRTRAPWSPQPGTSVLCSALALRKPSPCTRWAQPSPTSCWPSWTSTTSASGCLSSVRPGPGWGGARGGGGVPGAPADEVGCGVLACLSPSGTVSPAPTVVRNPEGRIRLYCKGADTILLDRLHPSPQELLSTTTDHLNVGVQTDPVVQGLRRGRGGAG